MKFSAIVEQVLAMLQRQGRISYRALKREFDLDDAYIEDLKVVGRIELDPILADAESMLAI